MSLTPGKIYRLKDILYPRPFIYFIDGFARRCSTRPGLDKGVMFMLVQQRKLSEVANQCHSDKMGFKLLIETESGWIWFRDSEDYEKYFEEVTEATPYDIPSKT